MYPVDVYLNMHTYSTFFFWFLRSYLTSLFEYYYYWLYSISQAKDVATKAKDVKKAAAAKAAKAVPAKNVKAPAAAQVNKKSAPRVGGKR